LLDKVERLKWLRDGVVWLISMATGVILASATFYADIITIFTISTESILYSWVLLLCTILSGTICYFSVYLMIITSQNEKLVFNLWVQISYTVMLTTFLLGIGCFGYFILSNIW